MPGRWARRRRLLFALPGVSRLGRLCSGSAGAARLLVVGRGLRGLVCFFRVLEFVFVFLQRLVYFRAWRWEGIMLYSNGISQAITLANSRISRTCSSSACAVVLMSSASNSGSSPGSSFSSPIEK